MKLYVKPAEDGVSVGDCPFAHFVRMVLEEKGLEYELQPTPRENKPNWLVEHYQGKMPALRHRDECYVDSGIIVDYLEYFFSEPSLEVTTTEAESTLEGFFPAVAKYIKTSESEDAEACAELRDKLQIIDKHLSDKLYMDGESFTAVDCRLTPQLYHLLTAIEGFKAGQPNVAGEFPSVQAYFDRCTARRSFKTTVYPKETILWGWGSARTSSGPSPNLSELLRQDSDVTADYSTTEEHSAS